MKTFKRIAALAMSAVMAVSMMAPAWAAANPGDGSSASITITQTQPGTVYHVYKLFDVIPVDFDDDGNPVMHLGEGKPQQYVYFLGPGSNATQADEGKNEAGPWGEFITDPDLGDKYLDVVEKEYGENILGFGVKYQIAWKAELLENENAAHEFIQAALKFARENNVPCIEATVPEGANEVTIDIQGKFVNGYYLVDTSMGSLCMVDTKIGQNATIEEKNVQPTVSKQVWEEGTSAVEGPKENEWIYGQDGSTGAWGTTSNAAIGKDVYFRTEITVGVGSTDNLILWDDMSCGNFRIKPEDNNLHVYKMDADGNIEEVDWKDGSTTNWVVDYSDNKEAVAQANQRPQGGILGGDNSEEVSKPTPPIVAYSEERVGQNKKVNYISESNHISGVEGSNLYKEHRGLANGFCVRFMPEFCDSLKQGEKLIVTYTAEWRPDRLLFLTDSERSEREWEMVRNSMSGLNQTYVTYGADAPQESNVAKTWTYDYGFDLVKINSGETDNVLLGAEFDLQDANGIKIPLVEEIAHSEVLAERNQSILSVLDLRDDDDGSMEEPGREEEKVHTEDVYYRPATQAERSDPDFKPAVIKAGYVHIKGLDAGVYTLTETAAPSGYNMAGGQSFEIVAGKTNGNLNGTATLTIGDKNNIALAATLKDTEYSLERVKETWTDTDGNEVEFEMMVQRLKSGTYVEGGMAIVNLTGLELPHTGGIGTTIFYVVGGALVVGAGILLVTKKRMGA